MLYLRISIGLHTENIHHLCIAHYIREGWVHIRFCWKTASCHIQTQHVRFMLHDHWTSIMQQTFKKLQEGHCKQSMTWLAANGPGEWASYNGYLRGTKPALGTEQSWAHSKNLRKFRSFQGNHILFSTIRRNKWQLQHLCMNKLNKCGEGLPTSHRAPKRLHNSAKFCNGLLILWHVPNSANFRRLSGTEVIVAEYTYSSSSRLNYPEKEAQGKKELSQEMSHIPRQIESHVNCTDLDCTLKRCHTMHGSTGYYLRNGGADWTVYESYKKKKKIVCCNENCNVLNSEPYQLVLVPEQCC